MQTMKAFQYVIHLDLFCVVHWFIKQHFEDRFMETCVLTSQRLVYIESAFCPEGMTIRTFTVDALLF